MNKISFLDLKKQYHSIKKEVFQKIEEVCEETAFSGGKYVEEFEKDFAAYCQTDYTIALNNGTSALHMAMLALGVGSGDEVIVPANTFIATAWGVSHAGATPVFVDCDPDTWEIDPKQIEAKINANTKAIIGVHLYGQPFDIDAVKQIAEKHKIPFVEDAAQAHGALYKSKRIGSFGALSCFSFYPGKNLGTYGEGGAVTTANEVYAKHIQKLRNHGSTERYYHDEIGYNMRMGGIEGAVLKIKLKYLDGWNNRRKEIAAAYRKGITNTKIKMQKPIPNTESVYHLFVITTENREALIQHLQKNNIFPGLHYPVPCHLQKAYQYLGYKKGDLPHAEYLSEHCLSLPIYAELEDEEVKKVIEVLNNY
ncbi:MAG TPA: DegT/DnrJ/EryC1/StrS family aminotransferase [Cytophagaceae bacterium]|nr:DegT/DnrJ/EryC1/StrS family aminotransferase [Cytophagaceae bacterium]